MLNKLLHAMTLTLLLSLFVSNGPFAGLWVPSTPGASVPRYARNLNPYPLVSPDNNLH